MDRAEKLKHYMAQFEDEENVNIVVNPDGSTIRTPAKNKGDKIALRKAQLEYYIERDSRYIKSLTQQLKENQSILRVLNKGGISPDCNKSSTIMARDGE
jgi:hypothetical protein|tara:strand:+ start:244 stop:540 length:297 start_codon:yes stop_codon:yes gene_type:complete